MGILSKLLKSKKGAQNIEGSIDNDGIWRWIKSNQIDEYQNSLNEVFDEINIEDKKGGRNPFSENDGEIIMKIHEKYNKKDDFSFLYFQTMIELYIDADSQIRQMHRNCWAKTVTGYKKPIELSMFDSSFFPDPKSIMRDVRDRFF